MKPRGAELLSSLFTAPLLLPTIVLGLAILILFSGYGLLATFRGLVVGYDTSLRWVFGDDDQRPPPTPGWKLAGFRSKEAAEAYKAGARAQYGRTVSFPWDG